MIRLLNLLPFAISLALISIGWHDLQFPATALASSWKWWLMIGGLFVYMAAWNGWDRYRQESRDPLATPGFFGMWWLRLGLGCPMVGLLVPLFRLAIMAVAVNWIAQWIEHFRRV